MSAATTEAIRQRHQGMLEDAWPSIVALLRQECKAKGLVPRDQVVMLVAKDDPWTQRTIPGPQLAKMDTHGIYLVPRVDAEKNFALYRNGDAAPLAKLAGRIRNGPVLDVHAVVLDHGHATATSLKFKG